MKTLIGILALQGDFAEHDSALCQLGVETRLVKLPKDLAELNGLIIPGGESTTMALLMDKFNLREPLVKLIKSGLPTWGTCAGMIMLAKKLSEENPAPLGVMDITVRRNAFGRQQESFEEDFSIRGIDGGPMRAVFIRAPIIASFGEEVKILARLADGTPVAARDKNLLATSFHPELTNDLRLHQYFLEMIKQNQT